MKNILPMESYIIPGEHRLYLINENREPCENFDNVTRCVNNLSKSKTTFAETASSTYVCIHPLQSYSIKTVFAGTPSSQRNTLFPPMDAEKINEKCMQTHEKNSLK